MRYQVGNSIILFDGTGVEYHAVIEDLQKKKLMLRIEQTVAVPREIKTRLVLAVALPKGDRQKFLVEKLVELGVSRLIPLKTSRGVSVANAKVIQRLRKQVIEASKQCGRNTLLEIQEEQTIKQLADSVDSDQPRWIADPNHGTPIGSLASYPIDSILVAVGPEGGFDDQETQLARELGFQPVQLGPAILRIETAAIAVASILGVGRE